MNLRDIEDLGYRLDVEAGNLAVYGPEELLTDDRLEALRKHKQELIDQVLLRKFCDWVRAYGTDYQVLLSDLEIVRELDSADIECLRSLDTPEKQVWAELLAHRLTKNWTAADRRTDESLH